MDCNKIMEYFQDCNINFLIGSGASRPFLETLGNIEKLLTELNEKNDIEEKKKDLAEYYIYIAYFKYAMDGNIELLNQNSDGDLKTTLGNYETFLKSIHTLISKRENSVLNKQVNIYTTNIDIFFESVLESLKVEFNDGFFGRLKPEFDLNSYKNLRYRTSYYYDNVFEVPVFNLFKLHGSLNWFKQEDKEGIFYDRNLKLVKELRDLEKESESGSDNSYSLNNINNIDDLLSKIGEDERLLPKQKNFLKKYQELLIVNPTKRKFKETVLNQTYYDMLRIYANELEKENTVLFVIGFSFADEHIRSITLRALESNPTLTLIVFAYDKDAHEKIKEAIDKETIKEYNNIIYCSPEESKKYDLEIITEKFFK